MSQTFVVITRFHVSVPAFALDSHRLLAPCRDAYRRAYRHIKRSHRLKSIHVLPSAPKTNSWSCVRHPVDGSEENVPVERHTTRIYCCREGNKCGYFSFVHRPTTRAYCRGKFRPAGFFHVELFSLLVSFVAEQTNKEITIQHLVVCFDSLYRDAWVNLDMAIYQRSGNWIFFLPSCVDGVKGNEGNEER